jgi:hypothetical protein
MQTLSYGYELPENGDRGSVWFPSLANNITQLNGHTHDGVDSAQLNVSAITKFSQTIDAGDWVIVADGTYRQEVTMPANVNMSDFQMRFEIEGGAGDNDIIFPSIEHSAANKYYVYINDNTLNLRALYS